MAQECGASQLEASAALDVVRSILPTLPMSLVNEEASPPGVAPAA
jgi:hypothetical protein